MVIFWYTRVIKMNSQLLIIDSLNPWVINIIFCHIFSRFANFIDISLAFVSILINVNFREIGAVLTFKLH